MLVSHGDATGQEWEEVARRPYARVLWAHLQRCEHAALRSLAAKGDRLELASFNGLAFGNPAGLEEQRTLLRARIADLAGAEPVVLSREAALAAGEALRAQVADLDSQEE